MRLLPELDPCQGDLRLHERLQQPLRRRLGRRLARLPGIQANQGLFRFRQAPAHLQLGQRQHAQPQRQQPGQPEDLVVAAHEQRPDPQRAVFEPVKAVLQPTAPAVVADRRDQRQPHSLPVGDLHAPPQSLPLPLDRALLPPHAGDHGADLHHRACRPVRPAPPAPYKLRRRRLFPRPGHLQQVSDPIPCQHAGHRRRQGRFLGDLPPAPPGRGRQRPECRFGLGQAGLQRRALGARQLQRTDHLDPLPPCHPFPVHQGRQFAFPLVAIPQQPPLARRPRGALPQQANLLRPVHRGVDPAVDLAPGLPGAGQDRQIVVVLLHEAGTGRQGRPLTVPGIQHPRLGQHRPHAGDQRQVERVIGALARQHVRPQPVARPLDGGGHQLELGQVGAVILAVPQLHQPIGGRGMVAVGGGTIQAHAGQLHGVHRRGLRPELGFEGFPGGRLGEPVQDDAQAILTQFHGAQRQPDQAFERHAVSLRPLLHHRLAVVAGREDEGEPDRGQPAIAKPFVVAVVAQVPVQQFRETQPLHQADEQRQVVDPFVGERKLLSHTAESNTEFAFTWLSRTFGDAHVRAAAGG